MAQGNFRSLILAALVAGSLAAGALPATARDGFTGWTAGPEADATMDKGRRFDCSGGICPSSGLSCLHAQAPADQPLWRNVPTKDLARRNGMPWKAIEGWLATKLTVLKPALSGTSAADARTWTISEPAELVDGERFLAKTYAAEGASVPTAFWMEAGRLNVLVCAVARGQEGIAKVKLQDLVGNL